ncbi:MAG: HD domain-containing protein [Lachnospiraceae bacterium]|nr:HD domain-containing protein [Lachnospiraceae bacterium]
MKATVFGAIYIGSYEVSLKIFTITRNGGIKQVDHVRTRLEIGRDVYAIHYIESDMLDMLTNTLKDFKQILEGYKVDAYRAIAGSIFLDIKNREFILDQINIRCGIKVEVLSNSERRFISFQSVVTRDEFEQFKNENVALVDIGGDSLQVTLFSDGKLLTTEHLTIGTIKLLERLSVLDISVEKLEKQMEELIAKEFYTFKRHYLSDCKIDTIVFMGEYASAFIKKIDKKKDGMTIPSDRFLKVLNKFYLKNVDQIFEELELYNDHDMLVIPYIVLYRSITEVFDTEKIWVPGTNISEGIAYDYALGRKMIKSLHNMNADIISAAEYLAGRYNAYTEHTLRLRETTELLFDTLKKYHGLNSRAKLLLEVAAILHDVGKYISIANGPECAYDIIINSEIIGLSHIEREIVADVVLFNTRPMADYEDVADRLMRDDYITVAKLASLLRVSNALDRSHRQKMKKVKVQIKEKNLILTIETDEDMTLEKTLFNSRVDLFENTFGLKPVLNEKRVY